MRHPSARGLGVRYLIAVLLPISGAALVVYTAVQLAIAHATHNVPPPRRIAEVLVLDPYSTPGDPTAGEATSGTGSAPSFPSSAAPAPEPAPVRESGPAREPEPAPTSLTR